MKHRQFTEFAQRLDRYAQDHPKMYKAKVLGLLALGYGYLILMLALLLAMAGGVIAMFIYSNGHNLWVLVKISLILFPLIAVLVRALLVRIPAPQGLVLKSSEAPGLFKLIERLRTRLRAPKMHRVLLVGGLNAAVCQHPRLGLLGWHRNYLIIGLPMLQALTPEQFEAVLAHELGHLSGAHGRLGIWIYRVRESWGRLLESFKQRPVKGSFLFLRFFHWFIPLFHVWSCILARDHEYEADEAAGEAAGAESCARALLATNIHGAFLNAKFYQDMERRAAEDEPPPLSYYSELGRRMREGYAAEDVAQWVGQALKYKTDIEDSHPSLADRLGRYGVAPGDCSELALEWTRPLPPESAAAQALLGAGEAEACRRLDSEVMGRLGEFWQEAASTAREQRKRLEELALQASSDGSHNAGQALEHAVLIARTRGVAEAAPLLRECAERPDAIPQAFYVYGRALLDMHDELGIQYIDKAIRRDPELILPGCQLVINWLKSNGRAEEAERWYAIGEERNMVENLAEEERTQVLFSDEFLPHGLPEEVLTPIRMFLRTLKPVKKAYLVRKRLRFDPEETLYVIGLSIKFFVLSYQPGDAHQKVLQKVVDNLDLPSGFLAIVLEGVDEKFEKRFKKVAGARFYKR